MQGDKPNPYYSLNFNLLTYLKKLISCVEGFIKPTIVFDIVSSPSEALLSNIDKLICIRLR